MDVVDINRAKKYLKSGDVFIGYNESSYSWEYTSMVNRAFLFYRSNGNIELIIHKWAKDNGINQWERSNDEEYHVGTINKPDLSRIKSILAKNSFKAGYSSSFKVKWLSPKGVSMNLSEIIQKTREYLKMRDNKTNENQVRKFVRKALLSVIKEVISEDNDKSNFLKLVKKFNLDQKPTAKLLSKTESRGVVDKDLQIGDKTFRLSAYIYPWAKRNDAEYMKNFKPSYSISYYSNNETASANFSTQKELQQFIKSTFNINIGTTPLISKQREDSVKSLYS